MSKAEKIRAEIEKRMQELRPTNTHKMQVGEMDRDVLMWLNALTWVKKVIDSLEEEPVSNDLEKAAWTYYDKNKPLIPHELDLHKEMISFFIAGAQWQKKHLEMNRIKYCDNITEEQYNLETGFLDEFIDKHDRMPTFLDAIEYGMNLQKEQDQSTIELAEDHAYLAGQEKIIDKACEWLADNYSNYIVTNGLATMFKATIDYDTIKMIEDFKKAMEE